MAWRSVGSVSCGPSRLPYAIGRVELPPFGGIVVRVQQTSGKSPWPFSYGLLWVQNSNGRELGTIKVHGTLEGDTYRLGAGLPSLVGGGILYFSPRTYNARWLARSGELWNLAFSYDNPAIELPQDRYQAPGFMLPAGRLLQLVAAGSLGRLQF